MPPDTFAVPPLEVTLLGTGTSVGVPVIGCGCAVCTSGDPRDRRLRTSAYVRAGGLGLLIDAGPDFRQQALRHGIDRIDAVLFTHPHVDHIAGLDDLRPYFFEHRTPMPCYVNAQTAEVLRRMYPYVFLHDEYKAAPKLELEEVQGPFLVFDRYEGGEAQAQPVAVAPVKGFHGQMPVYGYRIGRFGYVTDVNRLPEASLRQLRGVDTLVLDALRPDPHPTHFSFDEAVEVARAVDARQTYFTHMTHDLRHADADFPTGIAFGHDGLTFRIEGERITDDVDELDEDTPEPPRLRLL